MHNQMHGKSFENRIKSANGIFSYAAADRGRQPDERFDIGRQDDNSLGIPTSVKTTGSETIFLSDARKFWESIDYAPYRVIVGRYKQADNIKRFYKISMFIIKPEHKGMLFGTVERDEIRLFHEGLTEFEFGEHEAAREFAREQKSQLQNRLGEVKLNPKIDSRTQRRLQCSIHFDAVKTITDVEEFTESFGNLVLPLSIISTKRSG